jgi:exopolyphosphatase/guanosine-5'-triphosphate,3'-diphosphate pyrophosphatase
VEGIGLALHVLTHREEALLALVGATDARRVVAPTLVVDLGGGSTEIVRVEPGVPPVTTGVSLGTAGLTARFAMGDPPIRDEVRAMIEAARGVVSSARGGEPPVVVAVGGTAENLLRVAPAGMDGGVLTRDSLAAALERLGAEPAAAAAARYGVRPLRARLLPAGAAILLACLDAWRVDHVRVSANGLREGALLAVGAAGLGWRDRLPALARGWRD